MFEQMYKQNPALKELFRSLYGTEPIDLFRQMTEREDLWLRLWSTYSFTVFWGAIISLINALFLKRKAK